jgi:hypothetical protein
MWLIKFITKLGESYEWYGGEICEQLVMWKLQIPSIVISLGAKFVVDMDPLFSSYLNILS